MGLRLSGWSCSAFGRASEIKTPPPLRKRCSGEDLKPDPGREKWKEDHRINLSRTSAHGDRLAAAPGCQQLVERVDLRIERGDIRTASAAGSRLTRRYRLIERSRVDAACGFMVRGLAELTAYGSPVHSNAGDCGRRRALRSG